MGSASTSALGPSVKKKYFALATSSSKFFLAASSRGLRPLWLRVSKQDVCATYVSMCIDVFIGMYVDLCIGLCVGMCIAICIDMCMNICLNICLHASPCAMAICMATHFMHPRGGGVPRCVHKCMNIC